MLAAARARRDAGDWPGAIAAYSHAATLAPEAGEIRHSLALCAFAAGNPATARANAEAALARRPTLWQSHALLARIARAGGETARSEAHWRAVLAQEPANGAARTGLADLALNEYGDPETARALTASLTGADAADGALVGLMSALYIGDEGDAVVSARLARFADAHFTMAPAPPKPLRAGRRRIGLLSPLFSASPVHFLTFSTWAALAVAHDLVVLSRGRREDWATAMLQGIAAEWHALADLDAPALAEAIRATDLDILFDLGGWSDVIGLAALAARPAPRQYKWIGGQSATTGLRTFDGWIGDAWQSPPQAEPLHSEPLIRIAGGYCDYLPPPFLRPAPESARRGVALVGNPAKIGAATLRDWPTGVARVTLIDRRYAHERTRLRITELLARHGVAVEGVVAPAGQSDYLAALARHDAIVNTSPYAAGLTAVEAHALGLRLLAGSAEPGLLFCRRHHLSHRVTGGRNPALAGQIAALVAR